MKKIEEKVLNECGFVLSVHRAHADEYKNKDIVIYTDEAEQINLIINPEDYVYIKTFDCKKIFNSNLNAYPKELNKGETKTNYGYKIVFDDSLSMKQFLVDYLKYKEE